MEALLVSTTVVALGEIGDKTQLLALMLAARFRRSGAIIAGIFVATLANHTLAASLGAWVRNLLAPDALRWLLAIAFLAVALWTLKPDRLDDAPAPATHLGAFAVTTVAFFLAEMGDKTQVATVMLAAKFEALAAVIVGTTLGMLAANVPVVLAGNALAMRIPMRTFRLLAAAVFALVGVGIAVNGTALD